VAYVADRGRITHAAAISDIWPATEPSGDVNGSAIGQRHHGADTGGRHQAPAHLIILDNGQQAAMQEVGGLMELDNLGSAESFTITASHPRGASFQSDQALRRQKL
jgi:hypothetical protein